MKTLKKVNKGVVLTVIILLILIIYLISVETKRNTEKPKIEEECKSYIQLINKYAVMPENVQKLYKEEQINKEEKENVEKEVKKAINSKMDSLEEELKKKMINNELAVNMQREVIQNQLNSENNVFKSVTTSFNKEISKIKKMAFDEDQVTVTFKSKVEKEIKYLDEMQENVQELSKRNNFDVQEESITLKKVDGTWKVIYADLQYQDYTSGFNVTSVSY